MHARAPSWLPLGAVLLAVASVASGAPPAAGAAKLHGAYTLRGDALVRARPVLDERVDVDVAVLVGAGDRAGTIALHLSSGGYACDLRAAVDGEALRLASGQACTVDLDEPDARGRVVATLRSGQGRARGGRLELVLGWDVRGDVSVQVGGQRYEVLGREVEVPATWAPRVPVSGSVEARAEGPRESSPPKPLPPASAGKTKAGVPFETPASGSGAR